MTDPKLEKVIDRLRELHAIAVRHGGEHLWTCRTDNAGIGERVVASGEFPHSPRA